MVAHHEAARELGELGGAPVVVAHEQLGGEQPVARRRPQRLRQVVLQVEREQVALAPGGEVGLVAHPQQEVVGAARGLVLALRDPARGLEPGQPARPQACVRHPEHAVQLAQAALALLDVRLLDADGALVLRLALLVLAAHRLEERLARAPVGQQRVHRREQLLQQLVAARHQPRLGERGARVQVLARHGHALLRRAEAVADRQPRVPEQHQDLLDERRDRSDRAAPVQEQQVDVGVRRELGPAVAAERDHRAAAQLARGRRPRRLGRELAGADHDLVDLVSPRRGDLDAAQPHPVPHAQPVGLELQEALEDLDAAHVLRGGAGRAQSLVGVGPDALPVQARHAADIGNAHAGRGRSGLQRRHLPVSSTTCDPIYRTANQAAHAGQACRLGPQAPTFLSDPASGAADRPLRRRGGRGRARSYKNVRHGGSGSRECRHTGGRSP